MSLAPPLEPDLLGGSKEISHRRVAVRSMPTRLFGRLWRGAPEDPAWARPGLLALFVITAGLYMWDLSAQGWANAFYSAAVQAGTKSWKAFFFGSFDPSNFITVDKPPASLWIMELSARLFGLNSWSILVPQAIEGVASVGLLYAALKRWFSPGAGLIGGAVFALTPVAALMFRYNNPDALLVLLLVAAAYGTVRALERGSTWWLACAGACVGFGFITKMLQALLVVPALAFVYLVAGPPKLGRRIFQLGVAAVALVVSAGWWVAAVQLTPAADRPYIGGSQDNSLFNLIFGYNGFGRLSGNEAGSVGGAPRGGASIWGPTGWSRMFNSSFGGQASWLLPAALVVLVAGLWMTRRAPRQDRKRAGFLLWGGWLIVTVAVFSFAQGIIHPYYTIALAPAIGALVGMGAVTLWAHRQRLFARATLAATLVLTASWAFVLLSRTPSWFPWLRGLILVAGLAAAAGLVVVPMLSQSWRRAVVMLGVGAALCGPVCFTLDTVATPASGALPMAGPSVRSQGPLGPGQAGSVGRPGPAALGARGGAPGFAPASGIGPPAGFGPPAGSTPPRRFGRASMAQRRGHSSAGGGAGGLLHASAPDAALIRTLRFHASSYRWVAAAVGANQAAGYQLGSGDPVMAIGGFNGTDPAPSLAMFEKLVKQDGIHYFIASGSTQSGPPGPPAHRLGGVSRPGGVPRNGPPPSAEASAIVQWVESHFTSKVVGGITLYDLSVPNGTLSR